MSWAMIALPLLSGLLYGLSFPPFNLPYLAWICLVPLLLFLKRANPRVPFLWGSLVGLVANLLIYFWIWKTFEAAEIGFVTTLGSWLLLSLVLSLYFGVFSSLYVRLPDHAFRPLLGGALWVVLDHVRSLAITGFPWGLLAHTQAYQTSLLQFISFTGTEGLTFVLVTINIYCSKLCEAWPHRKTLIKKAVAFGLTPLILILVPLGFGWLTLKKVDTTQIPSMKVAMLQGNINQYQKWSQVYEEEIRTIYQSLALKAAKQTPDLIVWPETAVPGWYPNQIYYSKWMTFLATATATPHLFGAVTRRQGEDYNSAFLINESGKLLHYYDKQHLVPFGEYIPFGGFLKRVIPYLGQLGIFDAGAQPVLFHLKGVTMAPNICYEAIFPSLVRRSLKPKADVIVNITNDGWYLDTGAPEQHYVANIFRAVENRRSVVRVANTGISAIIDPYGREVVRSPLLEQDVYTGRVPLLNENSFYFRAGPWFTTLCWMVLLVHLIYSLYVTRIKRKNQFT